MEENVLILRSAGFTSNIKSLQVISLAFASNVKAPQLVSLAFTSSAKAPQLASIGIGVKPAGNSKFLYQINNVTTSNSN